MMLLQLYKESILFYSPIRSNLSVSLTVRVDGTRAQSLFPWLIRGADFDNDSAFMNDVVVPWCRSQKIEVTRSRAYKKNDQALSPAVGN